MGRLLCRVIRQTDVMNKEMLLRQFEQKLAI